MEKTFEGFWNIKNSDLKMRLYYGASIINLEIDENNRTDLNECFNIIKKNHSIFNKYKNTSYKRGLQYLYLYGLGYPKLVFFINPYVHLLLLDKEKKLFKKEEKFITSIKFETLEKCIEFLQKCEVEPPYFKEFNEVMLKGFSANSFGKANLDEVLKWRIEHIEFYEYYKKQYPEYNFIYKKIEDEIKRKQEKNKEWDPFGEEN